MAKAATAASEKPLKRPPAFEATEFADMVVPSLSKVFTLLLSISLSSALGLHQFHVRFYGGTVRKDRYDISKRKDFSWFRRGRFLLLGALLASKVTGQVSEALERLTTLSPADLLHAVPTRTLLRGPILELAHSPEGLLVLDIYGVRSLDANGLPRWHTSIPGGIRRYAIPRSGRWIAGHSTRITPNLDRIAEDWILDSKTGERFLFFSDTHPMAEGAIDRKLIAWDPLPFSDETEDSEADPSEEAAPTQEATTPLKARLTYSNSEPPGQYLLEEGLFVLRTTDFLKKGKSWWSLHHFDPATQKVTKIGDGSPGLSEQEMQGVQKHPTHPDRLALFWQGLPAELDLLSGVLTHSAPGPAPQKPAASQDDSLTIHEVYHLEAPPTGGVALIHPKGRRTIALADKPILKLTRLPGATSLFALEGNRKRSLLPEDQRLTLHRIEFGRVEESLREHRKTRSFQENLNQALELVASLNDPSLWRSEKTFQTIKDLLKDAPADPELRQQAHRVLTRARLELAVRMEPEKRIQGIEALIDPIDSPQIAAYTLGYDRRLARTRLETDLATIVAQPELWKQHPHTQLSIALAYLKLRNLKQAEQWLTLVTQAPKPPKAAASAAVHLGDLLQTQKDLAKAAHWYRNARLLKPESQGAAWKLLRVLLQAKEPCQAVKDLSDARQLDPGGEPGGLRATHTKAAIQCGPGYVTRALLDSLRIDHPLEPTYLEWDADLLIQEGKPRQALPMLKALERLKPTVLGLREKRERLESSLKPKKKPDPVIDSGL